MKDQDRSENLIRKNEFRDWVNAILFSYFLISNPAFGGYMAGDPFDFDQGSLNKEQTPISTATTFSLTENDKEHHKSKALGGDSDSAFRLHMYYMFSVRDYSSAQLWLLKSAELGNVTAQYNLIQSYISEGNHEEALYWFKLFSNSGHPRVNELKVKLDKFESNAPYR